MNAKHTPTPWFVVKFGEKDLCVASKDGGNRYIANLIFQLDDSERANADFIVRAVNNFEGLLFYAKDILEQIEQFKDRVAINTDHLKQAIKNSERKERS